MEFSDVELSRHWKCLSKHKFHIGWDFVFLSAALSEKLRIIPGISEAHYF